MMARDITLFAIDARRYVYFAVAMRRCRQYAMSPRFMMPLRARYARQPVATHMMSERAMVRCYARYARAARVAYFRLIRCCRRHARERANEVLRATSHHYRDAARAQC